MTVALNIDALRGAAASLPSNGLASSRQAAIARLSQSGTPTTRDEDWKYTDLSPLIEHSNRWLVSGARNFEDENGTTALIQPVLDRIDAHWLIIRNGRIDADVAASLELAGIRIRLLSESGATPMMDTALAEMNIALLTDGLHIEVDSSAALEKPLGILLADFVPDDLAVSQVRVDIEMATGSRADFVEYHCSGGGAEHYANTVVNLDVGAAACARYVRINDRAGSHSQTGRLRATMAKDSRFEHAAFDLGGRLIRNDLAIDLAGRGAESAFHGLYLADADQHIDNHTRVDHRVGPAHSKQEYRGILSGSARCVWNGKAIVHAGADGTDAEQANHNLLLSEKAEIDAKPELEIYADDVKCSHGTTIGQLDENALFYLRTRGLDRDSAKSLLMRAFAHTVVGMLSIESLKQGIAELVESRLEAMIEGDRQ
ncbi:MAG: Fe-S cluster assembly protein SufD [Gammaproteobacteria bacterium]|nr:Fe-S cluster assembly protein SufD [Gammaproteobacteria bacterium]